MYPYFNRKTKKTVAAGSRRSGRTVLRRNEPAMERSDALMSRRFLIVLTAVVLLLPTAAFADHQWGNYHWGRTANPFTLKAHDTLSVVWEPYLQEAANDWSASTILDIAPQWGQPLTSARRCTSANGRIEVCNAKYGNNGWLGLAGIYASGDHITKAYTKVNDTYFNTATYNTPAWRRLVMCQEIAHDFGLDHQDETFDNANLGSCMDYTNDPDGGAGGASNTDDSNEHPNLHDFDQIEAMYAHLDAVNTYTIVFDDVADRLLAPPTAEEILADAGQWGAPIGFDGQGRPNLFMMRLGTNREGAAEVGFTHVFWAPIDPFNGRDIDRDHDQ